VQTVQTNMVTELSWWYCKYASVPRGA